MNKSKLFIGLGALVLAISAFTTNANKKKYLGTISGYFKTSGGAWNTLFKQLGADSPRLTTVKGATWISAFFKTGTTSNTNGIYRLYKAKNQASGNTLFVK